MVDDGGEGGGGVGEGETSYHHTQVLFEQGVIWWSHLTTIVWLIRLKICQM